MTDPTADALAWLALLVDGRVRRNRGTAEVCDVALGAGWVDTSARRDELVLRPDDRSAVEDRLDRVWPTWREARGLLSTAGLPSTPSGWRALREREQRDGLPGMLPAALNRRTAAAAVRAHSKLGLRDRERATFGATALTHDNLLRLRPHAGLRLVRDDDTLDAARVATFCGDVALTERAFRSGTRLAGPPPRALLLVENLGVFVDVLLPDGWCAAHVPGWNTRMVTPLQDAWPGVPALLFGDLDPNGVAIARSLLGAWPELVWFVPPFAEEYFSRALPGVWPDLPDLPPIAARLAATGRWLEQEVLVLDPRLGAALEAAARDGGG